MSEKYWVVAQYVGDGRWDYWSNEYGWGSSEEATRFTEDERNAFFLLPLGGEWQRVKPLDPKRGYTPGPWRVSENHHNILSDHSPHHEGRPLLLASVYHVEPMGVWDHTETHANAVLMATSPLLYEALRQLVNYNNADPDLYVGDDDGVLGRIMYEAQVALGAATRREE